VKQLPAEEQIAALLKNEQLWHADLSFMTATINEMCACLKQDGPRQLLASIDTPEPSLK
jgi:tagaturonate reductase